MVKLKDKYFGITLLIVLVISSVCILMQPIALAGEVTNDSATSGSTFLSQVAGFDSTKYNITTTKITESSLIDSSLNEILPTENIHYTLESDKKYVEILETFANGNLAILNVIENDAAYTLSTSPTIIALEAKTFLNNYQTYSDNSFYEQLASMLTDEEITKNTNSTTINGNIKLDITIKNGEINSTTFTWSYISNGINTLDKSVSLKYQDGFLKQFTDTWDLYQIGGTTVSISEEQAEEIAMENAQAFTWTIASGNETIEINNFNVTQPVVEELIFSAADSDPLTLYPVWHIGVDLDKYYPGNVYGIYVDIWADTGQIKDVYEVYATLPSETEDYATIEDSSISNKTVTDTATGTSSYSSISLSFILLLALAIGSLSIAIIIKKAPIQSAHLRKIRKVNATIFCFLITSVAFASLASAIPTADAATAYVWGEYAAGGSYLYHTDDELTAQTALASYINTWYGNAGYNHYNYQANNQTTKTNILNQAPNAAVNVYFDHGVGNAGGNGEGTLSSTYSNEWHYQLCTDLTVYNVYSQNVYDYQLYATTTAGTQYFSYISTCHSASLYDGNSIQHDGSTTFGATGTYGSNSGGSGYIIGMPYAWTHGASMSTSGFLNPDSGAYCYLGFVEGSASLNQDADSRSGGTETYAKFVYYFFDGLLNNDLRVNDALDYAASNAYPTQSFDDTMIYSWFSVYWPEYAGDDPDPGDGKFVVYGNSDMYLYPGGPDYVSTPSVSGPTSGTINTAVQFSASATDPYGYSLTYTFNWGDGSSTTTSNPSSVSHTYTSANTYTVSVQAQSSNGVWSGTGYSSDIVIGGGGTTYDIYLDAYGYVYGVYYGHLYPSILVDGVTCSSQTTYALSEGYHTFVFPDGGWMVYGGLDYYYGGTDHYYTTTSVYIGADGSIIGLYYLS